MCVPLCACPKKNECRKAITCLKWWPNYDSLLQHAALQNQTPWNWLPIHLHLICDHYSPAPLSVTLRRILFIPHPHKNKKRSEEANILILNPGHKDRCWATKLQRELTFAEMINPTKAFLHPSERKQEETDEIKTEGMKQANKKILNYHLAANVVLLPINCKPCFIEFPHSFLYVFPLWFRLTSTIRLKVTGVGTRTFLWDRRQRLVAAK